MVMDSRKIDIDKVLSLIATKLNINYFGCRLYSLNEDILFYSFMIFNKKFNYSYIYEYRPENLKIREMNKILKRKNQGEGTSTEELVVEDMYKQFMADWIGMAKCKKESKQEDKKEDKK